jgi:hypothetical protein
MSAYFMDANPNSPLAKFYGSGSHKLDDWGQIISGLAAFQDDWRAKNPNNPVPNAYQLRSHVVDMLKKMREVRDQNPELKAATTGSSAPNLESTAVPRTGNSSE